MTLVTAILWHRCFVQIEDETGMTNILPPFLLLRQFRLWLKITVTLSRLLAALCLLRAPCQLQAHMSMQTKGDHVDALNDLATQVQTGGGRESPLLGKHELPMVGIE